MEPTGRIHFSSQVSDEFTTPVIPSKTKEPRVDSLNVRDDTEIDWKTLPDPGWNFWSAHSLQRRWLTLKRSIKGFEDMTHQGMPVPRSLEICATLILNNRNYGYTPSQKGTAALATNHCIKKEAYQQR